MTAPARPRGWRSETTYTGGCDRQDDLIWKPCPMCWGQGRILEERPADLVYAETCETCLGVGMVESR